MGNKNLIVGAAALLTGLIISAAMILFFDKSAEAAKEAEKAQAARENFIEECRRHNGTPIQQRVVKPNGALGTPILVCSGGSLRMWRK